MTLLEAGKTTCWAQCDSTVGMSPSYDIIGNPEGVFVGACSLLPDIAVNQKEKGLQKTSLAAPKRRGVQLVAEKEPSQSSKKAEHKDPMFDDLFGANFSILSKTIICCRATASAYTQVS